MVVEVLMILFENAIKFRDTSQEKHEVNVKVVQEEKNIKVFVSDTGIGIAKEDSEKIFSHFRQADEGHNRLFDGIGLGLSLAQKNIMIMGGMLWLEKSDEGQGSTFCFTIPILGATEVES